eukprot:4683278-Prymnesium_polylepis.1
MYRAVPHLGGPQAHRSHSKRGPSAGVYMSPCPQSEIFRRPDSILSHAVRAVTDEDRSRSISKHQSGIAEQHRASASCRRSKSNSS